MMDAQSGVKKSSGQQTFPASTFPETFKDFFSMINEDEDHVELVSNLEDKVSTIFQRSVKVTKWSEEHEK